VEKERAKNSSRLNLVYEPSLFKGVIGVMPTFGRQGIDRLITYICSKTKGRSLPPGKRSMNPLSGLKPEVQSSGKPVMISSHARPAVKALRFAPKGRHSSSGLKVWGFLAYL